MASRSARADELVRTLGAEHAEQVADWLHLEAHAIEGAFIPPPGQRDRVLILTQLSRHVREAIADVHGSASDEEE